MDSKLLDEEKRIIMELMAEKIFGSGNPEVTGTVSSPDSKQPSPNDSSESDNSRMYAQVLSINPKFFDSDNFQLTKEIREKIIRAFFKRRPFRNTEKCRKWEENVENEEKSTKEEVANLSTKDEAALRFLIVSKKNSKHEGICKKSDLSKHEDEIHKVPCECKNVDSTNVDRRALLRVEQDRKRSLHDIPEKSISKEAECTITHSEENGKENCTIDLAEDTIPDYEEYIQYFEMINNSTQNVTKELSSREEIIDLSNSDFSDSSQVESRRTRTTEEEDEIATLIRLWKRCQNLYCTHEQKECKGQDTSRDSYLENDCSEKENENTLNKCQEQINKENKLNTISKDNVHDSDSNKKINVSNESKGVTGGKTTSLSCSNCSNYSQAENIITVTCKKNTDIQKNILLEDIQGNSDTDKQKEVDLECISQDICYENSVLEKQNENIQMTCQDEIDGKKKSVQQNEITLENTELNKMINDNSGSKVLADREIIDLGSPDCSRTSQMDNTIELSTDEEADFEKSIILIETDTENDSYRDNQERSSKQKTITKSPMDDQNGKFFIDKYLVPVQMYQDGLSVARWNPTQVLYEICSQCRWSRPEFSMFDFNMDTGFLFSLRVQDHTFIPEKRSWTKKQAKHNASSHFLSFLGFEFTYDDLKTAIDNSSSLLNNRKLKNVNRVRGKRECTNQGYSSDSGKENYKFNFTERAKTQTRGKNHYKRYVSKQRPKRPKHNSYKRHRSSSESSSDSMNNENISHRFYPELDRKYDDNERTIVNPREYPFNTHAQEFTPYPRSDPPLSFSQRIPPFPYGPVPPPHNPQAPFLPYPRIPPLFWRRPPPLPYPIVPSPTIAAECMTMHNYDHRIPATECRRHRPVYLFL